MALRCFLFSSDEGTSDTVRQALTGLGVEGESCSEAATAVARLGEELFQIVVIDWDRPEAPMLLSAARDRKPAERPLMLAVISDDASVPKVLQAGANSILKKPLLVNQVTDTLTTARDLLRSRQETASATAQAAAAAASTSTPSQVAEASPHSGPLVPAAEPSSGTQFETDTEVAHFSEASVAEQTDPLKDLEPMAAAVAQEPPPPPPSDEPKGLEWYLKARGVARQPASVFASSPAPVPKPVREAKPELLGFDQSPSVSSRESQPDSRTHAETAKRPEPELFSYITGGSSELAEVDSESGDAAPSRFGLGKKAIAAAIVLAALAIAAAPQAPWHPRAVKLWAHGRHTLLAWLNPQPVTSVSQAPTSHEDFARPGDEYKLPVAETIPDATTDPSQINVVPVVDPTVKRPAPDAAATNPVTVAPDTTPAPAPDAAQPPATTSQTPPTPQPAPAVLQPAVSVPAAVPTVSTPSVTPSETPASPPATTATPVPHRQPSPYVPVTTKVPTSLQSQMTVMTPDASGNKPVDAALPAIEPVAVSELSERALLTAQPQLAYPANAVGKQGTVILQVLIGRDGTVQDAKFLQGSLAFARAAIDGVKQWKFKPYLVNGRPVSVATNLTIHFAPGQ